MKPIETINYLRNKFPSQLNVKLSSEKHKKLAAIQEEFKNGKYTPLQYPHMTGNVNYLA